MAVGPTVGISEGSGTELILSTPERMLVRVHVYICTLTYRYKYIYSLTYRYTYVNGYLRICTYTYGYIRTLKDIYVHLRTCTYIWRPYVQVPLPSQEGTPSNVLSTFTGRPRPESGRDCLIRTILARLRTACLRLSLAIGAAREISLLTTNWSESTTSTK